MSAHIPERLFVVGMLATLRPRFIAAYKLAEEMVNAGHAIEIIVRLRKSKRTVDQNRRLWALYREVAATVWVNGRRYSDETWHEHFKRQFIGTEELALPDGSVETRGISTTTLDVGGMTDYMRAIELWCAEQGFPVMQEAA